jgi:hypothetical protein
MFFGWKIFSIKEIFYLIFFQKGLTGLHFLFALKNYTSIDPFSSELLNFNCLPIHSNNQNKKVFLCVCVLCLVLG